MYIYRDLYNAFIYLFFAASLISVPFHSNLNYSLVNQAEIIMETVYIEIHWKHFAALIVIICVNNKNMYYSSHNYSRFVLMHESEFGWQHVHWMSNYCHRHFLFSFSIVCRLINVDSYLRTDALGNIHHIIWRRGDECGSGDFPMTWLKWFFSFAILFCTNANILVTICQIQVCVCCNNFLSLCVFCTVVASLVTEITKKFRWWTEVK